MNRKQIIAAFIVVLVGGVLYLFVRHAHRSAAESAEEEAATLVTVEVGRLRQATLHGFVTGYGSVLAAPADDSGPAATARVAPAVAGVVTRVVVSEGAQVEKGAPLVDLDARAAEVAVKYAEALASRQEKLFAEHNTSLKSLQDAQAQLETARAQLALWHVTAPLSGTVTHVNVRPGEAVDPGAVLAEITDLSRLVVAAQIPSGLAAGLKRGQPFEILGATPMTTSLTYVSPAVDPANDTVTVRAAVPPASGLRLGSAVRLRIVTTEHANCLAAPAESVVAKADGQAVIAVVTNDEAVQVPVKTGLHDGDLIEIEGGKLKSGDVVVTVGAYGLPEKTKVHVVTP
jgi:membrane fusion protein, multidrug efflux system